MATTQTFPLAKSGSSQWSSGFVGTPDDPNDDACVLDIGLLAYAENVLIGGHAAPEAGEWLTGRVQLSVDHFAYMEHRRKLPAMPALIYTWSIDEIQVALGRDSWRTIDHTRAWEETANYRLRCTLLGREPAHRMTRTGPRWSPAGALPSANGAVRTSPPLVS